MVFFTHSFSRVIVLCFEPVMMSPMQNIIGQWLISLKHYILMCLLLSSPERLPHSFYCMALTGLSYFLIGLLLVDADRGYAFVSAQIVLELGMLALITYVGLRLKNSLPRFLQTYSALIGINVVITAVTIPFYDLASEGGGEGANFLIYLTLAILIWNLAVLSLIFKRAFEISTHLSSVISFVYFVVYQFAAVWLYP
jgi:hypothetical protein